MVHTASSPTRSHIPPGSPSAVATAGRGGGAFLPYLLVPDALILAFAHDPLAIGIYVAIARLVTAAKQAVPVAARDLALWMGRDRDADRATVMRRIVKLAEAGWLSVERSTSNKHRLLPTWGLDISGEPRLWRFDASEHCKPEHVRGRRVPLALLDTYLGRLDTQPGHTPAVISRYFTRPLLDLTDIGVYTIALRAEVTTTARLQHLGLVGSVENRLLSTPEELLHQAVQGSLTTYDGATEIRVFPSPLGYARLACAHHVTSEYPLQTSEHVSGSPSRSTGRSVIRAGGGSPPKQQEIDVPGQQDARDTVPGHGRPVIAWDVRSLLQQTNQSSSTSTGGGGTAVAVTGEHTDAAPAASTFSEAPAQPVGQIAALLEPAVAAGHLALNPLRPIPTGEWYELLGLQRAHGAERLLIWQARAVRRAAPHSLGITPGYYRACAKQEQGDALHQRSSQERSAKPGAPQGPSEQERAAVLDPACDALLRAMGVRDRQQLAGVPYGTIKDWQNVLEHPGLTSRFSAPLGFAVSQMRQGNLPPPLDELEGWANAARRKADQYDAWRHIEPQSDIVESTTREAELEARVRALAPPNADLAALCALASLLEEGMAESDAVAQVFNASGRGAP
jgi:hypothetical protein